MKGFISWSGWRGEKILPVSKIITIGIKPYTYHKHGKDIKRWNVECELDVNNPGQKDIAWGYETEAEAREFYNYCLKQIAEWQDNGGENG